MITREIQARSILSKSGIGGIDYCINPYVGCSHGCVYCYASFMKRFTGHRESWGTFLDVKINSAALLARQIKRARTGTVLLSSVTDCYQPAEAKYGLTRACLDVLSGGPLSVDILTKSPLVLRDLNVLKTIDRLEVGFTITTDDEGVRKIFEPGAPPVKARIDALRTLHDNGISTYAFIGPMLPLDPETLAARIRPHVDRVLVDRMNYPRKTVAIYRERMLGRWLERSFVEGIMERLARAFAPVDVVCC